MADRAEGMAQGASRRMNRRPIPPSTPCRSNSRNGRSVMLYTQTMEDIAERYETRQAKRAEYLGLMRQLDKNRRIIYLGSCLLCLFIGFLAGYLIAYPKESKVVAVEVPLESQAKAQTTSL